MQILCLWKLSSSFSRRSLFETGETCIKSSSRSSVTIGMKKNPSVVCRSSLLILSDKEFSYNSRFHILTVVKKFKVVIHWHARKFLELTDEMRLVIIVTIVGKFR